MLSYAVVLSFLVICDAFSRSAMLIPFFFVTFHKLYFVQQLIVSPFDGTICIILTNLKMGCL